MQNFSPLAPKLREIQMAYNFFPAYPLQLTIVIFLTHFIASLAHRAKVKIQTVGKEKLSYYIQKLQICVRLTMCKTSRGLPNFYGFFLVLI